MVWHATKAQVKFWADKLLNGETIGDKQKEAAEKFLESAEGKEYVSIRNSIDNSGRDTLLEGQAQEGSGEGNHEGNGNPANIPGGNLEGDSGSGQSSENTAVKSAGPLDPESVVSGILEGSIPATKDRPAVVLEVEKPKRKYTKQAPGESRVGPTGVITKKNACRMAGYQTADMIVISGVTFFGPEWNYLSPQISQDKKVQYDERLYLREAYADMFEAYGWDKIPPWVGALAATGSYILVRVKMPETKKKLEGFMPKLKDKLKSFFKKKETPPPVPAGAPT